MLKRTHILAAALLLAPGIAVAKNITGSDRNDALIGTPKADHIQGFGGNDIIDGRGGDDVIEGGANGDTMIWRVGDGNDTVDGGPPSFDYDDLVEATAVDFIKPVALTTTLEHGRLVVRAGPGQGSVTAIRISAVNVVGGSGNDKLVVGDLSKSLGRLWHVSISGGPGDDLIDATRANPPTSRMGFLTLLGGPGNDIIKNGDGSNTIFPGPGNDTVYTGSGVNQIRLSAQGRATLHLGSGGNEIGSEVRRTPFNAVIYNFKPGTDGIRDDRLHERDLLAFDTNRNGRFEAGDKAVKVQGGNLSVDFEGTHITFMGLTSIPDVSFEPAGFE